MRESALRATASAPAARALRTLVFACCALAPGAGCREPARAEAAPAPASARDPRRARAFTDPAARCGECHGPLYEQWRASAHATVSPAYAAMRAAADASCDSCHAPLLGQVDDAEPSAHEAVTCDGCHALKEVTLTDGGARLGFKLDDAVKLGPLCEEAKPSYFHKAGCSPLHQDARLCAGCHQLRHTTAEGTQLPILTEYAEWAESENGRVQLTCQGCHMQSAPGQAAVGSATRPQIHQHGFGPLKGHGLKLWLTLLPRASGLEVEVRVKNERGGHALPTGFPGHQLLLRVELLQPGAAPQERIYSRRLVDGQGREVPFLQAHRLGSDTRIQSDETRVETFTFPGARLPGPLKGELRVTLLRRNFSPELARALSQPEGERTLLSRTVPFGGRAPLPKKLEMNP